MRCDTIKGRYVKPKLAVKGDLAVQVDCTVRQSSRVRQTHIKIVEFFHKKESIGWCETIFAPCHCLGHQSRYEDIDKANSRVLAPAELSPILTDRQLTFVMVSYPDSSVWARTS